MTTAGFTRQTLRVQITSNGNLRIFGERFISGNKWQRFSKEYPIPSDSNKDQITASFESETLFLNVPKTITTTKTLQEQTKKPAEEPPRPQKPKSDESQSKNKSSEEKVEQKEPSDVKKNTIDTSEIKEVTDDFIKDSHEQMLKNEKIGEGETKGMNDMCFKLRPQESKDGVKNLVKEKKNGSLINLIVAVLLLLFIGFNVKNGIFKSKGDSKSTEL